MSAVSFIVLKRPGGVVDQLLQSLVQNFNEEMTYTYTVK
jgi:ferritin-like protein